LFEDVLMTEELQASGRKQIAGFDKSLPSMRASIILREPTIRQPR